MENWRWRRNSKPCSRRTSRRSGASPARATVRCTSPPVIAGAFTESNPIPAKPPFCGLPTNQKNEGRSLAPLLKDPAKEWPYPAITGWLENSFAIQTETHRYLRYGDGSEELYDHQTDLNEWTNLARHPEHAALKKKLAEWIPKPPTP